MDVKTAALAKSAAWAHEVGVLPDAISPRLAAGHFESGDSEAVAKAVDRAVANLHERRPWTGLVSAVLPQNARRWWVQTIDRNCAAAIGVQNALSDFATASQRSAG